MKTKLLLIIMLFYTFTSAAGDKILRGDIINGSAVYYKIVGEESSGSWTGDSTWAYVELYKVPKNISTYNIPSILDKRLVYPDYNNYSSYRVVGIGHEAFSECSELTSVTIPTRVRGIGTWGYINGITLKNDNVDYSQSDIFSKISPRKVFYIDYSAFSGCTKLTSIIIPDVVKHIGNGAFKGCTGLTSITIPNNVRYIGSKAFEGCTGLINVKIPNNKIIIFSNTFRGCTGLTSITIPDGVERIEEEAFSGCTGLTSITIPDGISYIGPRVFEYCTGLTSLTINTTNIEKNAFRGCIGLTSISISNSATNIGDSIFSDCSNLKNVYIGDNVNSIAVSAFSGCDNIISVTINTNSIIKINYTATSKTNLSHIFGVQVREYVLGNNVKTIGRYAFANCKDLVSISIPKNVNNIGEGSFIDCSNLKSITIGQSVKNIGDNAFNNCSKITDIYSYAKLIPIDNKDPFKGVSRNATLWVPAEYYSEYKHDSFWGEFDVQPMGAEGANTDKVVITPDYNTANVVWPQVSNVDSYELVIKDKNGNEVCTLVFNGDGQLQSITFRAPAANPNDANRAPQQTQATGFRFTVTGLESGCTYGYTITAKDAAGKVLQTYTGSFTTLGATGVEDVETSGDVSLRHARKIYKDGNVLILLPDGRRYNLQGAEVK